MRLLAMLGIGNGSLAPHSMLSFTGVIAQLVSQALEESTSNRHCFKVLDSLFQSDLYVSLLRRHFFLLRTIRKWNTNPGTLMPAFPQKWDKDGIFVRRYVPELEKMDKKFIYEPWKAPIAVQKKAGVTIQGDGTNVQEGVYPRPIFDFAERRAICLDKMKKAYEVGLYGNSLKVIDGSWRELFDDSGEGPTEGKTLQQAMGNGHSQKKKVASSPMGGDDKDGVIEEDETGAKNNGEEHRSGNTSCSGTRKRRQATLDGHFAKRPKI